MRKTKIITILVILAMGGIFAALFFGPKFGKAAVVNTLAEKFLADVQFKDFRQAALYHHKLERDRVDIGRTIEKLFLMKPEMIDIREFRIIKSDIDGNRARVHMNAKFQRLNMKKEPEEGEIVLYFLKRNPDCPIGGSCRGGFCYDEFDKKIARPEKKKKTKKSNVGKEGDLVEPDLTKKNYSCTDGAEDEWFMNLDSTLKEKRYNH